jgi:asparagine synthase (glutamine-hydrolysing)
MTKLLWQGNGSLHALETLYSFSRDSFEELLLQPGMAMDLHTRACLYTPEFKERLKEHNPVQYFLDALPGSDRDLPVDRYMQAHMCTTLPDDYLTKVDNATMATALEARCPLLDLEVVKLAMQIPAPSRFHRFRAKGLLSKIAERHVPRKCIWRRKRGFVAPVAKWLARDWTDLVDELILGPHLEKRRWFRRDTLSSLVAEHRNGIDHGYLLWSLMVLELWVRMSVDHTLQPHDII